MNGIKKYILDMFILHCAPVTNKSTHGLCRSVVSLAIGQHRNKNKIGLITLKNSERLVPKEIYWKVLGGRSILKSFFIDPFKDIINTEGRPDVVNFHDIYDIKQVCLLRHAIRNRLTIYITPRGAFSPVALKRSKLKKLFFIKFFINPFLKNIEAFVALNENEKGFIKKIFLKKTIIIGNGINDNRLIYDKNQDIYLQKNKNKELIVGFVGRFDIHIKGLDTLLNAYAEYQKISKLKKIRLVFLGEHRVKRNEYDSIKFFKAMRSKLVDSSFFKIIPAIYGDSKYDEIMKFDVLIQPSRTEGMPNTVLEAMSVGIPCCVSPETNMQEILEESKGGWVINRNVLEIKKFFLRIEEYDKDFLSEIGINGMKYAYKHLLWDNIGKIEYK